jgi:phosphoglycerate dehydrogenase-like enzyme
VRTEQTGLPLRVAFAGVFAGHVADRVRAHLEIPCEIILGDEREIVSQLGDVDVLVGMGFTREMAAAAPRLRLVQVPGAGLDRIDRRALGPDTALAAERADAPHVSGWTEGMMESRAAVIAENIHRVARGEAPVNRIG